LVMMLFVVIILITKVLPIFSQVFSQLGSTMSPVAQSIMGIGTFINNNMIVFIVLVVILFGVFFYLFATEKGKDRIIGLFSFGKTGNYIETAFFASAMSMALQSGLDADESLSLAENLLSGTKMTSKIKNCQQLIVDGKTFADAIAKSDIFSPLYCRMLDIGFKTGSSDTVMEEIAIRTEKAANEKIDSVIAGIEPILVIIMSVTVGLILLSVMLPLMNIMSSIG
ncbi:MAG: type II secretion system F family protein, partial [Anaerotignaceae bacterium]